MDCEIKKLPSDKPSITPTVFGNWRVEIHGDMSFLNNKGFPVYEIWDYQLKDPTWIHHLMTSKGWIDLNDFIPAYFQALTNIGIKEINILIHH